MILEATRQLGQVAASTLETKDSEGISPAKIGKSQVTGLVRLPVTWMLEIDGSLVPTRVIGQDKKARVEYREVKTVVLYQKNTPSERYHFEYFKEVLNNAMRTGISMRRRRGKPNSVQKLEA